MGGIAHLDQVDAAAFTLGFGEPPVAAEFGASDGVPVVRVRGMQLYPLDNGKRALVVAGEVALSDKARKHQWSIEAVVRNPEDNTARVWPSRKFPVGRPLNPELVAGLDGPDNLDAAIARAPKERVSEGLYPTFTVVMFEYPPDLSDQQIELRVLKGQDTFKTPAETEGTRDDGGAAGAPDGAGDGAPDAAAHPAGEKRSGTFVNLSDPAAKPPRAQPARSKHGGGP